MAAPDLEVGIAVLIGCLVPIAAAIAVLVGGVVVGARLAGPPRPPAQIEVRVIDDGAPGGPAVLGTTIVPLR